jgi:hypothetical protein
MFGGTCHASRTFATFNKLQGPKENLQAEGKRRAAMRPELEEEVLPERMDSSDVPTNPLTEPTYDEIAAEAYARYLSRGGADGGDISDWLEAEHALREQRRPRGD